MKTIYFNCIKSFKYGEYSNILRIVSLLIIIFYPAYLQSQSIPNLEIFYRLSDSAAVNASKNIPAYKKSVKLDLNSGNTLSILNNQVLESFHNSGKNIINSSPNDTSAAEISFRIDKAVVDYGDLFQQKLFGDFYTERKITLSGNYILFLPGFSSHNFNYTYSDTVNANDIKNIENNAFPFTQSKLPSEPLFASIYEPVIAVGAAAITVILFFTIRSK